MAQDSFAFNSPFPDQGRDKFGNVTDGDSWYSVLDFPAVVTTLQMFLAGYLQTNFKAGQIKSNYAIHPIATNFCATGETNIGVKILALTHTTFCVKPIKTAFAIREPLTHTYTIIPASTDTGG